MNTTINETNNEVIVKKQPFERFYSDERLTDEVKERYVRFVKSMIAVDKVEFPSLFKKMSNIVERYVKNYKNDFYVTDISAINQVIEKTDFIWVVRPNGTHLIQLKSTFSLENRISYLKSIGTYEGDIPFRYYLLNEQTTKKISYEQALELIENGVLIQDETADY